MTVVYKSKLINRLCADLMQVFPWGRPVGNYAFLESRDQYLQGRLWLVVVSRPLGESQ